MLTPPAIRRFGAPAVGRQGPLSVRGASGIRILRDRNATSGNDWSAILLYAPHRDDEESALGHPMTSGRSECKMHADSRNAAVVIADSLQFAGWESGSMWRMEGSQRGWITRVHYRESLLESIAIPL